MVHCSTKMLIKLSFYLSDRKVERVVVLIGKKTGRGYEVMDVLRANNEDHDPANKFFISNRQLNRLEAQASQKGYSVIGIAHSHPAHHPVLPSIADVQYCAHAVNAVYHPATRSLTWFNKMGELVQERVDPLSWIWRPQRYLPS